MVITQNNNQHKTILGDEYWRAVGSITHCEIVFEKEVIFHEFDFETSKLVHTTSWDKGVFPFNFISQLRRPI